MKVRLDYHRWCYALVIHEKEIMHRDRECNVQHHLVYDLEFNRSSFRKDDFNPCVAESATIAQVRTGLQIAKKKINEYNYQI